MPRSEAEHEELRGLVQHIVDKAHRDMREAAREEVASLCGLVLNRLGEFDDTGAGDDLVDELKSIFGEALRDFSTTTSEPGPEPV